MGAASQLRLVYNMTTNKQSAKFTAISENYINGNKRDAAAAIKKLSKLELAIFMALYNNPKFHNFIVQALTNVYQ